MDCASIVQRQRAYFLTGATRALAFRQTQLKSLHDALHSQADAIAAALHADLRKSPQEAWTTETGLVLSEIDYSLRHLPAWMRRQRRGTPLAVWLAQGFIEPSPLGVALIIGPWNYPLQLMLAPLVGALAAGNCAVLKPSEYAPHTADALTKLISTTFPPEYVTVVNGDSSVAESLLKEKFDFIFYTGNATVGRKVMAAAAQHLTPVALELGGKSPCLVCADAPIELAARRIIWGKFLNAGQTCVAPDFVLAERGVRDALVAAMQKVLREFYGADPQLSPDFSRIIHLRHFDRLTRFLADGRVVHGGQTKAEDLYISPTLLADVPENAPIMQEEIFGPILPILAYDSLDTALEMIRQRPAPLALYLFTRDAQVQEKVIAETQSGGVCVNDTISHMIGKELPFGGVGESGMGAYHGRASFDCFSQRRPILRRSLMVDPPVRYPPPRLSLATMKRVLGFLLRR